MPRTKVPAAGANNTVAEHNLYDFRQIRPTTGNIFFVDSNAAAGGNGLSPEGAVRTIDAAIGLCTASNGDIIYVMEGHAESIAADASDIAVDVAGISIIGLGNGENRPVVTFTHTGATVAVSAANCLLKNLVFKNDVDAQVAVVTITGAGATIEDCEFLEGSSKQYAIGVDIGEDRCTVRRCYFKSVAAGADSAIKLSAAKDRITIEDCEVFGDFNDACIHNPTGTVCTRLAIRNNILTNLQSGDHAIELVSACTGTISRNIVNSTLAAVATATAIDPGSCFCNLNYGSDGVGDVSGVLNPAVDA